MLDLVFDRAVPQRRPRNRAPTIELFVGPIISGFQNLRLQPCWTIHHMPRVIEVPVAGDDSSFTAHARIKPGAGIGSLYVKGGRCDAVLDGPIHRAPEHIFSIVIHTEYKAAVDHDSQ